MVSNPNSINRNWQVMSEAKLSCNIPFTRSLTQWSRRQQACNSKLTPGSMTLEALGITARTSLQKPKMIKKSCTPDQTKKRQRRHIVQEIRKVKCNIIQLLALCWPQDGAENESSRESLCRLYVLWQRFSPFCVWSILT